MPGAGRDEDLFADGEVFPVGGHLIAQIGGERHVDDMHQVDPRARSPRLADDIHGSLNGGISGQRPSLRERIHLGSFGLDRVHTGWA